MNTMDLVEFFMVERVTVQGRKGKALDILAIELGKSVMLTKMGKG